MLQALGAPPLNNLKTLFAFPDQIFNSSFKWTSFKVAQALTFSTSTASYTGICHFTSNLPFLSQHSFLNFEISALGGIPKLQWATRCLIFSLEHHQKAADKAEIFSLHGLYKMMGPASSDTGLCLQLTSHADHPCRDGMTSRLWWSHMGLRLDHRQAGASAVIYFDWPLEQA